MPPMYKLCFESRCVISSNLVSLPTCCQFIHALLIVWRGEGVVSPPLRPSSLYSPYIDIVPYSGSYPYLAAWVGDGVGVVGACGVNEENAVFVIAC